MINAAWGRRGTTQNFDLRRRKPRPIVTDPPPPPSDPDTELNTARTTYGMWDYKRLGSITGGSNILTLGFPSTFLVGDTIIVEIGGESGQGLRGTVGVGGVVPANDPAFYYRALDVPVALLATITDVSLDGLVLTLNTSASTTATNAKVYYDNRMVVNAVLSEEHAPGWIIDFPAGDFAISRTIIHHYQPGWIIKGAGKDVTIFRTPKGAPSSGMWCFEANDLIISDFTFVGNAGSDKFGIDIVEYPTYGTGVVLTICNNCIIRDMSFIEVLRAAAWGEFCVNLQILDCICIRNEPNRNYLSAWFFGMSDCVGGLVNNCEVDSRWLIPGFETFRSNGVTFTNCRSRNGIFSSNSSGNFLMENIVISIEETAQFDFESFHPRNPIININSNIVPPDASMLLGGLITNVSIIEDRYINSDNAQLIGIAVNEDCPNVTITGGLIDYTADWAAPNLSEGPIGVNSTAFANTTVSNLTVTGIVQSDGNFKNINVANGSVTNCVADTIKCIGPNCILT